MADQEVIKHTKKIYRIWRGTHTSFWHKLQEFFLEIFIIVFAVTLSIWFHNRSEHRHQQEDVEAFLTGLKKDLQADVVEMNADKRSFDMQHKAFRYLEMVKLNEQINADSLRVYFRFLLNTTNLHPNNGRYEGFKSSGKMGTIENTILQNDILDLYQEDIPALLTTTTAYNYKKSLMSGYLLQNTRRFSDSTDNRTVLLHTEEAHNISGDLSNTDEIIIRYNLTIKRMEKIVREIDRRYK